MYNGLNKHLTAAFEIVSLVMEWHLERAGQMVLLREWAKPGYEAIARRLIVCVCQVMHTGLVVT